MDKNHTSPLLHHYQNPFENRNNLKNQLFHPQGLVDMRLSHCTRHPYHHPVVMLNNQWSQHYLQMEYLDTGLDCFHWHCLQIHRHLHRTIELVQ